MNLRLSVYIEVIKRAVVDWAIGQEFVYWIVSKWIRGGKTFANRIFLATKIKV